MGYNNYMFAVDRAYINSIRNLSIAGLKELCKDKSDGSYLSIEDILNGPKSNSKCIHDFGKWCDVVESVQSKGELLFTNKETQARYIEEACYIIGKDGLIEAIRWYEDMIAKYYRGLLESDEKRIKHVKGKIVQWENRQVIDISCAKEYISRSWEYEHEVFELAMQLKQINWKRKVVIFCGW